MKIQYALVIRDFPEDLRDQNGRVQFLHTMESFWMLNDIGSLDDDYYTTVSGRVDPMPETGLPLLIRQCGGTARAFLRRTSITDTACTDVYFDVTMHQFSCKRKVLSTEMHLRRLYDDEERQVSIAMDTRIQITPGPWAHHSLPITGESHAVQMTRAKIERDFNENVVPFLSL